MRRYACIPDEAIRLGDFSLTTVQDSHIEIIRLWRNAQMDVLRQAQPITHEQQLSYYETQIWPTLADQHPANLLLIFLEGDRPVGYGGLVHIAWEHRRAEVSFLLQPELALNDRSYSRYSSTYLCLLKRLAFEGLSLHRLFTETFATRIGHISVLESNGFRPEGRMRDHVRINDRPVDSLIHGCLNDE
jgi:RimJ/RimL family protein N-acetyltransferase